MKSVLVLGGTRFVGRLTAQRLAEAGHEVTVLSRREGMVPGTTRIVADRANAPALLSGRRFDVVLDFVAYDETGFDSTCQLAETYAAISSAWVPRLNGSAADAIVPPDDSNAPATMLGVTRRYLLGKARLEAAIIAARAHGTRACAIRLPILMGHGDHTGRLDFYRSRIADGGALLAVDGARNVAQILWSEDAARALTGLVSTGAAAERAIWEALPDPGRPVADFLASVADDLGRPLRLFEISSAQLATRFPAYLEAEPLWRESALVATPSNVFSRLGLSATPTAEWLEHVPFAGGAAPAAMRATELSLTATLT